MVARPEQIEQMVETFRRAAEANEATAGRRGNVVEIARADADEVMVTADLHGNRRNFNLIKRIAALDSHPRRHLILQEVCHGGPTYPGGGCMSHGLLEEVAKLKVQFPDRVHFLLSNHELAELTEYPIIKGNKMLNVLFRQGLVEMYGPASENMRSAFRLFIESCPLAIRIEGGTFVCHSVPEGVDKHKFDATIFQRALRPADFVEKGPVFALVWGRDFRRENAEAFARIVGAKLLIHGHEPSPEGFQVPNDRQIILDCCGERACYLMLRVGEDISHADAVRRIRSLAPQ